MPSIVEILILAKDLASPGLAKVGVEANAMGSEASKAGVIAGAAFLAIGTAAAVGVGVAVKQAADFQESMTALVTGAGEAKGSIDAVSQGVLDMAGQVGAAPKELAAGLYMIESAGYHGAAGLAVLKASAEGAKVGMADQADVANAVTSALNAYGMAGTDAAGVTGQLIATVAAGKMHMSDLAGAIGAVLPAAAAAHIPLEQVGAAIATMTAQGTPAADAATYLKQTILMLQDPSAKAAKAMQDVGLSAQQVATTLTTQGLPAALQLIEDHLKTKFPDGGAAATAALANIVGGTKTMQAALELTGPHMATFVANVASIGTTAEGAAKLAQGWADVQGDFNVQLEKLGSSAQAAAIELGTHLLPIATQLLSWLTGTGVPGFMAFAASIGQTFLPVLQQAGAFIQGTVLPSLTKLGGALGNLGPAWAAVQAAMAPFEPTAARIGTALSALGAAVGALIPEPVQTMIRNFIDAAGAMDKGSVASGILSPLLGAIASAANALSSAVAAASNFVRDHTVAQAALVGIITPIAALLLAMEVRTIALSVATAAQSVLTGALTVATGAYTAAQWLLNAALTANPIGIVILALTGLVAALVFAYNTSDTFRQVVNNAWALVKQGLQELVDFWGPQFEGFGTSLRDLQTLASDALGAIGGFFSALGSTVSGVIDGIMSKINAAMGALNALKGAAGAIGGIVGGAASAVGSTFNPNASAPGASKTPTSWVNGVPGYAGGTDNAPGGWAMVGEFGPELVNLPAGSQVLQSGVGGLGGGGDTHIHFERDSIVIQGHVLTDRQLVDTVHTGLLRKLRSNPSLGLVGPGDRMGRLNSNGIGGR